MKRPIPLQEGIIYGPIRSRRLGRSLGLNLFPSDRKICSFDCRYCHFGTTTDLSRHCPDVRLASVAEVLAEIEGCLRSELDFEYITFSGNGEPTIYPGFTELVPRLAELIQTIRPGVRLVLLSNSTTVNDERLHAAFSFFSLPVFKLDAGDQTTFEALNRPCAGLLVEDIVDGLARLARKLKLVVQSVMVDGPVCNCRGAAFESWLTAVGRVHPDSIQLYSTDRPVADASILRVSEEQLEVIAAQVHSRTGIRTRPYC